MKTSSEETTSRELVQLLEPPIKCKGSPFNNSRTRTAFLNAVGASTTTELTTKQIAQNQIELGFFLALLRQYLTDDEAVDILREFRKSGRWQSRKQVLWTGMNQETVQKWADEHDYITLTTALGRLKDVTHPDCLRRVKSDKAWSKYMKGASALFALCIAQEQHGSVLLVTPPPGERFNPQGGTNFQLIEAPILAGLWGPSYLERIDMVHPHVDLARAQMYQFWPQDDVRYWDLLFGHCPRQRVVWRAVKRSSPPAAFGSISGGLLGCGNMRPSEEARLEQSRRDKQRHREAMHQLELREQAIQREKLAQSVRDKKGHQEAMHQLELRQQAIQRERLEQSRRDKQKHQERMRELELYRQAIERERLTQSVRDKQRNQQHMLELEQQAKERVRLEQSRRDKQRNEERRDWIWPRAPIRQMETPARNVESEDARRAKAVQLFAKLVLAIMADGS